ncbi:protein kinase [Micromonospora sp. NPDC050397]|uniref:protein kinase domain-containing protein n=1 Tax=Micromonospora sp. NPDC050397 TaxID=3364279 RepID=UPI0038507B3F
MIADRYQLQSTLGRGGMAVVWRGVDRRLDRQVAIKLLNPAGVADADMLQRFDREARTAARLAHPNIVAVHDVGSDGGEPYLVMELVDGPSLADLLADGPLGSDRVIPLAAQVCAALATAHAAGVVHRDIKPANILIDRAGTAKVCDFGIARLLHGAQATLTAPATTIGTAQYMAPEQAAGDPVDARTDLYALGCLLFAMLTGRPPFTGENSLRVLWQHLHEPAPSLSSVRPDVPAGLDRLVAQLLAKDPADRPASATEVGERLTALATGGQPTAPMSSLPTLPAPSGPRPTSPAPSGPRPAEPVRGAAPVVERTRTMSGLDTGFGAAPSTRDGADAGSRRTLVVVLGAALAAALVIGILFLNRPDSNSGSTIGDGSPGASASGTVPAGGVPGPTTGAGRSTPDNPGTASASGGSPSSRPSSGPTARLVALQLSLDTQNAGEVDPDARESLNHKLDEVARELARNDTEEAAKKLDDVSDELDNLREDEKVGSAAYDVLRRNLDSLADSLRQGGRGGADRNG